MTDNKAVGVKLKGETCREDNIEHEMLKALVDVGMKRLRQIIAQVAKSKKIPNEWNNNLLPICCNKT